MPYNLIHIEIDTPWRSVLIIFSRYATTVCAIYIHTYTTVVCKINGSQLHEVGFFIRKKLWDLDICILNT